MKKIIFRTLIILISAIFITLKSFCANIDLSKSFVSDSANIIEPRLKAQLHEVLKNLHKETGSDVVVITLNSIPQTENFLTIENQIKKNYLLGGKNHDKWIMIILTTSPYQMNIRVGKGLKKVIRSSTIRAMYFEFLFSRLNNSIGAKLRTYNAGRDLYNTTMFLAELVADANNLSLHIDNPGEHDEIMGDLFFLLGGQNAHYFPKTDPTEKFIRRNNFHMIFFIIFIGFVLFLLRFSKNSRRKNF